MQKEIKDYLEKYSIEIQTLFIEVSKIIDEVYENDIEEKLWAKLPSYYRGDKFVRIIPFKDHINVEATAVQEYTSVLEGYKITPKGMLQIFLDQKVPYHTLRLIFEKTLLKNR